MSDSRRQFLSGAGALAVAGATLTIPLLSSAKTTNPEAVKLQFSASGDVPMLPNASFIVSPGLPPQQLVDLMPLLAGGVLKINVTQALVGSIFSARVELQQGPNPGPPMPFSLPLPISDFDTAIEAVTLGQSSIPGRFTFAAMGRIVRVNIPSPFGELLGRTAAYSAEFDPPGNHDQTNFYFFGGFVAGSHSTWVPFATGTLKASTPPAGLW